MQSHLVQSWSRQKGWAGLGVAAEVILTLTEGWIWEEGPPTPGFSSCSWGPKAVKWAQSLPQRTQLQCPVWGPQPGRGRLQRLIRCSKLQFFYHLRGVSLEAAKHLTNSSQWFHFKISDKHDLPAFVLQDSFSHYCWAREHHITFETLSTGSQENIANKLSDIAKLRLYWRWHGFLLLIRNPNDPISEFSKCILLPRCCLYLSIFNERQSQLWQVLKK